MPENDMSEDMEAPESPEVEANETADVPLSFFGDNPPVEGDTCTVKVISVDSNSGSATIEYVPKSAGAGGIAGAAEKFNQPEA